MRYKCEKDKFIKDTLSFVDYLSNLVRHGKKIIAISHSLNRTGAPLVFYDLVRALTEQGNMVDLIAMEEGPLREEYENSGISLRIADDFLEDLPAWQNIFKEYDAAIVNTLVGIEAIYALNTTTVPTIWWIHEPEYWFQYYQTILPKPEELNENVHVYGVSPITNKLIEKYCGYDAGVLPFGIYDCADTVSIDANTYKETVSFVLSGMISSIKGQDILCEAIKLLPDEIRKQCSFIIFGNKNEGEPEYYSSIQDYAKDIDELEVKAGMPHADALNLISSADYLLVPSRFESFSATAVEAMMLSKVPIISDVCEIKDLLSDKDSCLVFKSGNAAALSERITEAVKLKKENYSYYKSLCEKARKEYECNFSDKVFAQNVNHLIKLITNEVEMKNLIFLDWNNQGSDFLDPYFDEAKVQLSEIFTTNGNGVDASDIPMYSGWDYLVVSYNEEQYSEVHQYIRNLEIDNRDVIYISGDAVLAEDIDNVMDLLSPLWREVMDQATKMEEYKNRVMGKYAAVTAEGLSYVNNSKDECILFTMFRRNENWAKEEMTKFFNMANSRYSFDPKQDVFCDIGANIGTTSIYFKKKLDSNIKILAFEPSFENYKLLRVNGILNDVDGDMTVVKYALSDECGETVFAYDPVNPGASKIAGDEEIENKEVVKLITFDDYVKESQMDIERIKYIWVDVEGHEPEFIHGAKNTLKKTNVPIMMEFTPKLYKESGRSNSYAADLCEIYDSFAIAETDEIKEYPIDKIKDLMDMDVQCDIFLFKRDNSGSVHQESEEGYSLVIGGGNGCHQRVFQNAAEFCTPDSLSKEDIEWLSQDFDVLFFEKDQSVREGYAEIFKDPYYREKLSPKQMVDAICQEESEPSEDELTIEDRLKYLTPDTYKEYERLGDDLLSVNVDQAFLCYENAEYLCDDDNEKERISKKKHELFDTGRVKVKKTAFIILSYNNKYLMQRCIESIYANCNPESCSLIIFDNNSTDGVAKWLAEWGEINDEAIVVLSDENLGFSGGCNAAAKYAPEGEDIFLLNNDTRVPANALFWLRMGLYSSDGIGAAGSVQNYFNNTRDEKADFSAIEQYMEYGARKNVYTSGSLEEQAKLCGFALLIRRSVWDEVGGFDERFNPGYLEDDDISLGIISLGYKLVMVHNSFIYHAGSQSFIKRNDLDELYLDHRKLIIEKWGFDSAVYSSIMQDQVDFIESLADKGYTKDSSFSLLHINCGAGGMLAHLRYLYPKAELAGVEESDVIRKYAVTNIDIYGSAEALPKAADEYDEVYRSQ